MQCPLGDCRHPAQCEASEDCLDQHLTEMIQAQVGWLIELAKHYGLVLQVDDEPLQPWSQISVERPR